MKRIVTPFLLLSSIALTSCSGAKHAYAAYRMHLIGEDLKIVEISEYDLVNYLNTGIGFTVIFHNETCGICEEAMNVVNTNIASTGDLIFGVEVSQENAGFIYENLDEKIIQLYTPQVVSFNHKGSTYEYVFENLTRQNNFNAERNRLSLDSSFYYARNIEEGLKQYNSLDSALLFTFSSQYKDSLDFFTQNIADLLKKDTQNVIIVDTFGQFYEGETWSEDIANSFYISTKKAGVNETPAYYLNSDQTSRAITLASSY